MSIISIEKIGEATKIISDFSNPALGNTTLYTWRSGRIIVKPNNDDIEVVNEKVSAIDNSFYQNFKFQDQIYKYGATNAVEFVEYLIINDIFFLDGVNNVSVKTLPEATKRTEVGSLTYFAWSKVGTIQASPNWKCMKLDETNPMDINTTWADNANYSQIATDLTSLTYL